MSDKEDLIFKAHRISESAKRLSKLIEVNAPAFIIERERQILFRRLMKFPIDQEAVKHCDDLDEKQRKEEFEFLEKHGYFAEFDEDTNQGNNEIT